MFGTHTGFNVMEFPGNSGGTIVNLSTSLASPLSSQSISQRDVLHRCQAPGSEDERRQHMQRIPGMRRICHVLDFLWTMKEELRARETPQSFPFCGVEPVILSNQGEELQGEAKGHTVSLFTSLKSPPARCPAEHI